MTPAVAADEVASAKKGAITESIDAGWSSLVARRAHNPKVVGSNPAPATNSMAARCSLTVASEAPFGAFLWPLETWPKEITMSGKEAQLAQLLQPTIEDMGYTLWGIELISPGRRPTVRIYIDADAGVNVDDCAQVSHQVSGVLDVEDPINGEYTLEVSSPGVDRLLFRAEQYVPYVGEIVDMRLRLPVDGRRRFKGILVAVDAETVVVNIDDQEFRLPLRSVDRARAHPRLEIGQGGQ